MDNWDRSVVNLPFGRFASAVGEPIRVAGNADDEALENARRLVEDRLNATTEKVHAMVDGHAKDFDWNQHRTNIRRVAGRLPELR
jgi:hypothetical protein